jgi:hypothetical protein
MRFFPIFHPKKSFFSNEYDLMQLIHLIIHLMREITEEIMLSDAVLSKIGTGSEGEDNGVGMSDLRNTSSRS